MPQWYKFVLLYLWVAPHVLLAAVSIVMYLRRQYKSFPLFFTYALYETAVFLVLFPLATMASHRVLYRNVFIVTLAGSTVLRFGIIQELFNSMFHDYSRLESLAKTSMRWLTGLLIVAAAIAARYSPGSVSDNFLAGLALLDRSIAIIQAGLVLFLFGFSRMFGLSWRSLTAGIAMGFGIVASSELAVSAMRMADVGEYAKSILDLVPTGGFHIAVMIWLGYLLAVESPVNPPHHRIPEIDQWSGELERRPQ